MSLQLSQTIAGVYQQSNNGSVALSASSPTGYSVDASPPVAGAICLGGGFVVLDNGGNRTNYPAKVSQMGIQDDNTQWHLALVFDAEATAPTVFIHANVLWGIPAGRV